MVWYYSVWQITIQKLNTAKFDSVVRFSLENLLNSGCHVFRRLAYLKKNTYAKHGYYRVNYGNRYIACKIVELGSDEGSWWVKKITSNVPSAAVCWNPN